MAKAGGYNRAPFPLASARMRLDLFDLQLFVAVAELGNITRAAQRQHLALAAASKRMLRLEDQLGAPLLVRENRGVSLTPAGQALLHHAVTMLQQARRMREDVSGFGRGLKGHLRIFANTTAMTEFLPAAVGRFLAEHPLVSVDLEEHLSFEIVRAVAEGRADMGLVAGNVGTEDLEVFPYRSDSLVAVVPGGHPLAARRRIAFAELLAYDFVGLDEGSAIHGFLAQAANQLGRLLRVRVQLRSFDGVCKMVEARVGIAVVPESTARRNARSMDLKVIVLSDEWAHRRLSICVRRLASLPLYGQRLVEHLQGEQAGESPAAGRASEREARKRR